MINGDRKLEAVQVVPREPKMRIELTTYALRVRCSTTELPGRDAHSTDRFCVRSILVSTMPE